MKARRWLGVGVVVGLPVALAGGCSFADPLARPVEAGSDTALAPPAVEGGPPAPLPDTGSPDSRPPADGCSDACSAGGARCATSGASTEKCGLDGAGCRAWQKDADCPAGTRCAQAGGGAPACVCDTAACTPDAKRCNAAGNAVEVCVAGTGGCAAWMPAPAAGAKTCGAHQKCAQAGAGPAECVCEAVGCPADGRSCQGGSTVRTCATDADGCLFVQGTTPCTAPNPVCDNGTCVPNCPAVAPCALGQTECRPGNKIATCGVDANGCLNYMNEIACGARKTCSGAAPNAACGCDATACTANGPRCADGVSVETCDTVNGCLGRAAGPTACGARNVCEGAAGAAACACKATECTANGTRCKSGAELATCDTVNGCLGEASSSACGARRTCQGAAPTSACACEATPCAAAGATCSSASASTTCDTVNGCLGEQGTTVCPQGQGCDQPGTRTCKACVSLTWPASSGWGQVSTAGPARALFGMAYDTIHSRTVLFGGTVSGTPGFNDTYLWNGATWTGPVATLNPPPTRARVAMTFDEHNGRVVLFGGNGAVAHLGDTWIWDGVAAGWSQLACAGACPSPREDAGLVYDSDRHLVVLFGGDTGGGAGAQADTWQLDVATATWTPVVPVASPPAGGPPQLAYDRERHVIVAVALDWGSNVWEYDAAQNRWTERVNAYGPGVRSYTRVVYDASVKRVVLYGGYDGAAQNTDRWEWDGVCWRNTTNAARRPQPRSAPGMAYDSARSKIVIHGGIDPLTVLRRETWE